MGITKDEVKSRFNETEDRGPDDTGDFTGNKTVESKAESQPVIGETRAEFGDIKQAIQVAKKARLM